MPQTAICIEDGCVQCSWCQNLEATVFEVTDRGWRIRADARTDTSRMRRSKLERGVVTQEGIAFMRMNADGCSVQIIKIDLFAAAARVSGLTARITFAHDANDAVVRLLRLRESARSERPQRTGPGDARVAASQN